MSRDTTVSHAALLALLGGCGSIATSVRAVDDPPAPPATCHWIANDRLIRLSDPQDESDLLHAAVPTPDGALVAWSVLGESPARDPIYVRRFYADGSLHPWSAPGRASRDVVAIVGLFPRQFSLRWDPLHDGAAMLRGGPASFSSCMFVSFRGDDTRQLRVIDVPLLTGDERATCDSLGPAPGGWSMLTGGLGSSVDHLVTVSNDGEVREPIVPLPPRGPRWRFTPSDPLLVRSEVSDGFVATWVEVAGEVGQYRLPLRVRRYDARGAPRGDAHPLEPDADEGLVTDSQVVETPAGLLALWQRDGTFLRHDGFLATRRLRADGSPAAAAQDIFRGMPSEGMHAAVRGADVIVARPTFAQGDEHGNLKVHILDHHGSPRGEAMEIPLREPGGYVSMARVIPTTAGVLIVFSIVVRGPLRTRVVAVSLTCER